MPTLSFIHPEALWLLLLLIPIWGLAWLGLRQMAAWRFWSSLTIRTLLVVLLVLSLAGTQLVRPVDQVTTIFVIDSSDSVSPSARSDGEAFIQDALDTKNTDDLAAVVVFGENALVERTPDDSARLRRIRSEPEANSTNIENALQLGLALFPAETQKRLVLLSDGGENLGISLEAARLAAARNIPIETVDLTAPDSGFEAFVAQLDVPDTVRDGQDMELVATVESTVEQAATLRIFTDEDVVVEQRVELVEGTNEFRYTLRAEGQGFRRYRVQIDPLEDSRVQNNESSALVRVQGPPQILLVESTEGDATNLLNALQATNINAEVTTPDLMPLDLPAMSAYEAIVLVNVPARDLPIEALITLPTYVRDLGKGLVMIGGDESYGVGGYGETPVEEALPVYMDVRNREERPNLALMFVIDKSGSMDACHCAGPNNNNRLNIGGERKIDIAKEAMVQAAGLLSDADTLGIVGFDSSADWIFPATRGISTDEVADAVSGVRPSGDTNVRVGLLAAEEELQQLDARIKHVVLLTDGWGHGGSNVDVVERMREAGITVSVVAAGSGSASFLEELAEVGGGRFYPSETMEDVPEIFLQETIVAAGNYIVEGPFVPGVTSDSPILNGVAGDGLPPLYGYNGSTLKETARNVLVTNDNSPLLAQWQYGLGRSVAWTSDTTAHWAADWIGWEQFPRFTAQMVEWVIPTVSTDQLDVSVGVEGGRTTITVVTGDELAEAGDDLELTARVLNGDSTPEDNEEEATPLPEVKLDQVAPGEYRATIESPEPGTYFVQIGGEIDGRNIVQHIAGLVVPYSSEYRPNQSNPELLAELRQITDGREIDNPGMAFDYDLPLVSRAQEIALPLLLLALLLLPLDVAIRRLVLQRSDFRGLQRMVGAGNTAARPTGTPQGESTMTRLRQAKERAGGQPVPPTASTSTAEVTQQTPASAATATKQSSEPATPSTPATPQRPDSAVLPSRTSGSAAETGASNVGATPRRSGSAMRFKSAEARQRVVNPPDPAQTQPQQPAQPTDPLERLREAKERARRRVRGEE